MNDITGLTYKDTLGVSLTPLGLGPWSFSKLKMLNQCPLQFYLKYVIKAKVDSIPVVSVITETGKAAHRILELVIMGKAIEDAFAQVKKEYAEILPGDLWHEGDSNHEAGGVGRAEYSITKFRERLDEFEKRTPVKRYLTELKIGVTKDWEPTGFFTTNEEKPETNVYFRGVIDLIIQLENGDILFVDHKFGPPAVMGVKNFQDQLDMYKVLFAKGIQEYGDGQSGVHFIRDGEVVMGTMTNKKDIEGTLVNRTEFSIQGAIDKTKGLGYFKHVRGNQCKYCEFDALCQAGKLKDMEMETRKYFKKNDNV
jgi:hypothetical protein